MLSLELTPIVARSSESTRAKHPSSFKFVLAYSPRSARGLATALNVRLGSLRSWLAPRPCPWPFPLALSSSCLVLRSKRLAGLRLSSAAAPGGGLGFPILIAFCRPYGGSPAPVPPRATALLAGSVVGALAGWRCSRVTLRSALPQLDPHSSSLSGGWGRRGRWSPAPPPKIGVRSGLRPQRAFLSATALMKCS